MVAQTRLEATQAELAAQMKRIESAWAVARQEHETTQRQAVQLHRQFDELIQQQQLTQKMLKRLGKFGPALFVLVELLRSVAQQYLATHH